jgi:RNA binding exosome subunit
LKGPIQSLEVSYFVHATEDPDTIASAVSTLLSVDAQPEEEKMEGHFGNPIVRVRHSIIGEDAATALGRIATRLPESTKDKLERGIREFLDEHSALYLRFDKQRLVVGRLEEGTGDPIRVKVKPRGFLLHNGAGEFYSKVLFGDS